MHCEVSERGLGIEGTWEARGGWVRTRNHRCNRRCNRRRCTQSPILCTRFPCALQKRHPRSEAVVAAQVGQGRYPSRGRPRRGSCCRTIHPSRSPPRRTRSHAASRKYDCQLARSGSASYLPCSRHSNTPPLSHRSGAPLHRATNGATPFKCLAVAAPPFDASNSVRFERSARGRQADSTTTPNNWAS